jgi:hypothetical protein
MIDLSTFEEQFSKLSAAFSTSKSDKIMERWYEEFKYCEDQPFKDAMHRCQYGERFPTWDAFRVQYKNCLGEPEVAQDGAGCEHCINGRVFFWDFKLARQDSGERVVGEVVANCANCSPSKIYDLASVRGQSFYRDKNYELWSKRAYDEKQRVLKANRDQHTLNQ